MTENQQQVDVADVAAAVQELNDTWNPPADDGSMQYLIGVPREEGDGRATASPTDPIMQHPRNPARDDVDAQRLQDFTDDAGDDSDDSVEDYSGDEWSKTALQEEIDNRNADQDDEDLHISRSGNKDELRDRLIEDDANRRVEEDG